LSAGNNYLPDKVTSYSIANNTVTFTSTNTSYGIAFFIPLLYGTYRISYTGENVSLTLVRYNKDGQLIYSGSSLDSQNIVAIGPNVDITGIIFKPVTANTQTTISNIQIEEGTSATEYEEFNPDHTIYGGYVDIAKGELVAEWINKSVLWGDIKNNNPDSTTNIDSGFIYFDEPIIYTTAGANATNSFCNVGKYAWAGKNYNTPHFYPGIRDGITCSEIYLPSNTDNNTVV
jgi:hypothetical protein